jgi:hypothetical protein
MRTFKKKTVKVVDDVSCDCCGKSTTNYADVGPDYGTLEGCWGYGSSNDGSKFNIDLCESCFFEVLTFLKDKRRKVLGPFKYPYNNDPLDGIEYL